MSVYKVFNSIDLTLLFYRLYPAGIYLLKVNNRNTRTRCEICSKLTIKTPERRRSGVFIVNFDHISHLVLVFLLLTLNMQLPAGYLYLIVDVRRTKKHITVYILHHNSSFLLDNRHL